MLCKYFVSTGFAQSHNIDTTLDEGFVICRDQIREHDRWPRKNVIGWQPPELGWQMLWRVPNIPDNAHAHRMSWSSIIWRPASRNNAVINEPRGWLWPLCCSRRHALSSAWRRSRWLAGWLAEIGCCSTSWILGQLAASFGTALALN